MAELASPILGGINSARGMMSPRVMSGAAEQQREAERQVILSSVSNLVGGLSTRLDRIGLQINDLGRSLQVVSTSITQNSFLERQKEAIEQERERRIAEQQLREGQEALVERKIENATVAPVQKAAVKTQSALSRLMSFFSLLLTGWLAPKIIQGIGAVAKSAIQQLTNIKNLLSKGFASAGNVFAKLTQGLRNIIGSVTRTTSRVTQAIANGLFKYPIQVLRGAINSAGNLIKKPAAAAGAAATAAGTAVTRTAPSIFQIAKSLVTNPLGQIAFGTGINMSQGAPLGQSVAGAGAAAAGLYGLSKIPFLPFPIKLGMGVLGASFLNQKGQDLYSQFKPNANPFGGFDKNLDLSSMMGAIPQVAVPVAQVQSSTPATSVMRADNIGPAAEPQTNVVVTAAQQPATQVVPTSTNPFANEIPNISSSNADNFYVYYSMANYNVVI